MDQDFRVYAPLEAFEKAGDEFPLRIGGVVSTDELDKDEEEVVQQGLDFSEFLADGWFNDNHSRKTTGVLGYPEGAKFVTKGARLPNGKKAKKNGWWTEGYLLNTEEGRKIWSLAQALEKTPRHLGFSIEGRVLQRDRRNPRRVLRAAVRNVAITHCPTNTGTELVRLAKALTAGSAVDNPGASPGEGFPLRQESLDGHPPYSQEGSEDNAWEDDAKSEQDPEDTENLSGEDGDHPNDGGWAGINPHTTRVAKERLPPGKMVKAEVDRDFHLIDEVSHIEGWADAFGEAFGADPGPTTLTKSEARVIVRSRFPNLSAQEVDAIINSARQA